MHACSRYSPRGFTIVEAMVALLVLAVGMLGIAALYIESLRSARMSFTHTNAVTLVAGMAERIRANPNGAAAYARTAADDAVAGSAINQCVNGAIDCTPAQLAADDWFWWYQDIKEQMPEGRQASIQVVNSPPINIYTIDLQWPERGQTTPAAYKLTFSL